MRYYTKILIWENNKRLNKLIEFHELVLKYFDNSRVAEWSNGPRIENADASEARTQINRDKAEVYSIIRSSGASYTYEYTPPPVVGGSKQYIDVITNMFYLDQIDIHPGVVVDYIEMVIGIYESNQKSACWRIINPFFYIGVVLDAISNLPFIAIGKLGFNRQKIEASLIGRIFKGVFCIGSWIAIIITILDFFGYLDVLEPAKQIVHKLLGSNKTN